RPRSATPTLDREPPQPRQLAPLRAGGHTTASRRKPAPPNLTAPSRHPRKDVPVMTTTITLEANLTADPDLQFTKNTGQAVATIRLAASARRKNLDGEYQDTPAVFYEATLWGPLAEHAANSLRKGDRVLVHGNAYDEE